MLIVTVDKRLSSITLWSIHHRTTISRDVVGLPLTLRAISTQMSLQMRAFQTWDRLQGALARLEVVNGFRACTLKCLKRARQEAQVWWNLRPSTTKNSGRWIHKMQRRTVASKRWLMWTRAGPCRKQTRFNQVDLLVKQTLKRTWDQYHWDTPRNW